MPGDVGDFSVNIGLGINFLAFVSQFVTLRDTLTYVIGNYDTGKFDINKCRTNVSYDID